MTVLGALIVGADILPITTIRLTGEAIVVEGILIGPTSWPGGVHEYRIHGDDGTIIWRGRRDFGLPFRLKRKVQATVSVTCVIDSGGGPGLASSALAKDPSPQIEGD